MRWVLIVLGGVAILFAVIFAIGSLLSVSHVASVERRFKISVDDLWTTLTDYGTYSSWRTGIKKLTVDSLNHWTELNKYGDKVSYRMEIIAEKRTLITRILSKDLPYGGYWEFTLVPNETGCDLKIVEHGEVYSPLFRFMSRFIFGHETTLNDYMRDLEARVK